MIDDERFEIQSAFDLLPHVVGCSWATIWFRLNKIKNPTREEFRQKVTEYFKMLDPLVNTYPEDKNFEEIINYIRKRNAVEIKKISAGTNPEVEKRYDSAGFIITMSTPSSTSASTSLMASCGFVNGTWYVFLSPNCGAHSAASLNGE